MLISRRVAAGLSFLNLNPLTRPSVKTSNAVGALINTSSFRQSQQTLTPSLSNTALSLMAQKTSGADLKPRFGSWITQGLSSARSSHSRLFYSDYPSLPEEKPIIQTPLGTSEKPSQHKHSQLSFPKRAKKDLFVKNYPISKNRNVRHIIPLFLLKSAISKAHLCHRDDPELINFYEDILKRCGGNTEGDKVEAITRKFFSQVAKFRFNVFVGYARENSLLGHYGFRLFGESKTLADNINAIDRTDNTMVSSQTLLKLCDYTQHHLTSSLLLQSKKDEFSLQFGLYIREEFQNLRKQMQNQPEVDWGSAKKLLLQTINRIRDLSIFDAPQGKHQGVRETQNKHLPQAYALLMDYTTSDKADKTTLLKAFNLMFENEQACLAHFPSKQWVDLYPNLKADKSTNTAFAKEVGNALLMPHA